MKAFTSRYLGRIPVGLWIRRSIGKTTTYRVRHGNGFYGSILGETIQDRFAYNVSDPNADHVGVVNKIWFAAAIAAWQALSDEDKAWWNREAMRFRLSMSGYNLFIRKYERVEVHMYVNRGDPAAFDFIVGDFTTDGAWHDLDLSSIVPAGAIAVDLFMYVKDDLINQRFRLRRKGNTYLVNMCSTRTQVANVINDLDAIVSCDENRKLEYWGENTTWTAITLGIKGWFT